MGLSAPNPAVDDRMMTLIPPPDLGGIVGSDGVLYEVVNGRIKMPARAMVPHLLMQGYTLATDALGVATLDGNLAKGVVTLAGGKATVKNANAKADAKYKLLVTKLGGKGVEVTHAIAVKNIVDGMSFDIVSSSGADESTVEWRIVDTRNATNRPTSQASPLPLKFPKA